MTAATVRAPHDDAGPFPAASARMAGDLEVPRPLRLVLTAGWNVTESVGLPVAADWEVREVRLVASILGPSGPRYEPLELVQLAG